MGDEERKITVSTRIGRETRIKAMEIAKARGTTFSKVLGEFIKKSMDNATESSHDITDRVIVKMQDSFPQLMDGGNAEELADLVIMKMQDAFPVLMGDDVASASEDLDNDDEAELMEELAERGAESVDAFPINLLEYRSNTLDKFNKSVDDLIKDFSKRQIELSREEAESMYFAYMVDNSQSTGFIMFNPIVDYYKNTKNKVYGS